MTVALAHAEGYEIKLFGGDDNSSSIDLQTSASATIAASRDVLIESRRLPLHYELMQNYPNPFNPSTIIRFALPDEQRVAVDVYNARGRLLKTLVDKTMTAGEHSLLFDATGYSSGIYIYRLRAGGFVQSKKMVVLH